MKVILFLFFSVCIIPAARGDPVNNTALVEQIKQQNELMADLLQLYQAGYNPVKTDIASLLDHKKIEKYLKDNSDISANTGIMLAKMDSLKESVDSVDNKVGAIETRLGAAEKAVVKNETLINRNTTDISRIFYVIAVVAGFLSAAAWAGHSWMHRNDDRGG